MKHLLIAALAAIMLPGSTASQDKQEVQAHECRSGFLILEERILVGCQISEIEYRYVDYEQQAEVVSTLAVVEILYPGDAGFSRLESLMNLGRYEGLLMGVPGMQAAAQVGRSIGQAEGYAAGHRDALQQSVATPTQCGIDL